MPVYKEMAFDVESDTKSRLLNGLDDIGLTLESAPQIRDYETRRRELEPWLITS